ncbi:MAG: hypothetical protein AAGI23_14320 [Bacteroidota bacterium]
MNLNTQNHQAVINQEGETTSMLVPYDEYQQIIDVLRRLNFLEEMREDVHQSLREIKEAEEGKRELDTLQSLLDEH